MIYITYKYHRDVFEKGGNFKLWVRKAFGDAVKFHGFSSGMYEPTIKVDSVDSFENGKNNIKISNLIKVSGSFNVIETLAYGLNNFVNEFDGQGNLISSKKNNVFDIRRR